MTVAAVDVDSEKEVGAEFGIKGFPTIKVLMYQGSGQKPKSAEYRGPRTAAGIVEWALEQAGKVAQRRLGGKSGSSGKKKTAGDSKSSGFYDGTDVLQLDDSNFHSHAEEGPLFVEFYAPWVRRRNQGEGGWVWGQSTTARFLVHTRDRMTDQFYKPFLVPYKCIVRPLQGVEAQLGRAGIQFEGQGPSRCCGLYRLPADLQRVWGPGIPYHQVVWSARAEPRTI